VRLLKLKTSLLALVFSVVTLIFHLGIGYLLAAVIKNQMLAVIWQRSLKVYWPALDLIQIFRLNVNVGFITATASMILAALLQWWVIFAAIIWAIRFYFREPSITAKQKVAIIASALIVAFCFFKMSPEAFGDPRSPLERAMSAGDVQAFEKILKSNPSLANKKIWANNTPLNAAIDYQHPKEFIDLLVKYGADINAPGWPFDETPLQVAASEGRVEAVKTLLAHHPDVNALHKDKENTPTGYVWENTDQTALNYAFEADNKEIFSMLLDAGADINRGRSALAECMIYGGGKDSWPEFLLSKGADPNRKGSDADRFVPIIQAILNGNTNYVAALLKYHVDLNTRYENGADNFSPSELALDEGHLDIALMLQNYTLQTRSNTVSFAAANGDLDSIRSMIANNPQSIEDKDELGFTPLAWAAQAGQKSIVEFLLAKGADINSTDKKGNAPLHWAVFTGQSNIIETLINHKADLNLKGAGEKSPLHLAVQQGFIPIAETLLKAGANPNIAASGGETPLCIAVANGNVEAVKLLLAYHSDFGVHCYGDTLFHVWARGTGNVDIAEVLLANGCDVNARGREGQTPMHALIETASLSPNQQGQTQVVQWLLDHKADVNAKNDKGQTPLSLLKYRGGGRVYDRRKDIADLLRKYGAKE
jgi:cytohesin